MKVGIPRGLLYDQYHPFLERFFTELGAELVISPPTNKAILDEGVKCCVDEACLPVKVFHGHVSFLKGKCDVIVIPRIMQLYKGEYICPKFCGLSEMIANSIHELPPIIGNPIYATSRKKLCKWALEAAKKLTTNKRLVIEALDASIAEQMKFPTGWNDQGYPLKVALAGHPYNLYDAFINMNLKHKLNTLQVGVLTEECLGDSGVDQEVKALYKKPFWTFARKTYGFAAFCAKNRKVGGIVYVSSFACGIDSVIIELIRDAIGDFPILVLKLDEHTGEAGLDTRLEAFVDMLERSSTIESDFSSHGQYLSCR